MTEPSAKPPVFSLLSGSVLDSRKERQLRRSLTSLGATVDTSRNGRWNPATTHLVAVSPVPSVKWVCAIASAASVSIVKPAFLEACIAANDANLDTSPYEVPFAVDDQTLLPASMDALWAGRIWAPSYTYWRQRAGDGKGRSPLCNHRVLILGQLKPRGAAGIAAPSNQIVTGILTSAGARVVKSVGEDPTFAIAAPGLDPNRLTELKRALKSDVLCLGSAFLVDLICRVSADPSHYVMFESQKPLCGPLLDATSCKGFVRLLPVSCKQLVSQVKKLPRRSSRRQSKIRKEDLKSPFSVQGPDDISVASSVPLSRRKNVARDEEVDHVEEPPDMTGKMISPSTPVPKPTPCTPCPEKTSPLPSDQSQESNGAETVRRRRVRKRPRTTDLSVKSALQFDSPKKAKSASLCPNPPGIVMKEPGKPDLSTPPRALASKRTALNGSNDKPKVSDNDSQRQGSAPAITAHLEEDSRAAEIPSPQSNALNPPPNNGRTRSRLPQREQKHRSDVLSHAGRSALQGQPQAASQSRVVIDVDMLSQAEASSELSKRRVHRKSALLESKSIRTVEDGYNFVLGVLGGKPTKQEIDWILKSQGTEVTNQESQHSSSDVPDAAEGQTVGADVEDSPAFEEDEPVWFDDADVLGQGTQNIRPALGPVSRAGDRPEKDGFSGRNEHSRRERGRNGTVDVFAMDVPRNRITLSRVLQPKFAKIQYANRLRAVRGNEADDENCQSEVKYIDWVLGAERLIGCSREETNETESNNRTSAARRICLSLAESAVLSRFSSAGSLNEVEVLVLTGICTRLIMARTDFDSCPTLIGELLSLRDKQNQAGFDSLQKVLSAVDPNSVSIRHRAVATLWSVLIQQTKSSEREGMWSFFNNSCRSRLDDLFSKVKVAKAEHIPVLRNGLNWVLGSSLMVGYMHAIQLDFIEDSNQSLSTAESVDYPENWDLVCMCLERFSGETGTILFQQKAVSDVLLGFLSNIAIYVAHRAWSLTEKVLIAFSRAISFLSKHQNENCCCSRPALFVSMFPTLIGVSCRREGVLHYIKTPCDCYFLLGWLFATYGDGNVMKRAMGVIRNGSAFTNASSSAVGFSRAINHHVALTLTVADSLSSANEKGEFLLCRTLTSKCPHLETVMDRYALHGKEDDLCWRATVEAIEVRCRILHAKGGSIHIYTNWLAKSVVETFHKVRKSGEKRPSSVTQREALRVQESVFTNLALLTLSSFREVTDLLHAKAIEGDAGARTTARIYVENSEINVPNFVRIASDIASQMRSNPEESRSRSKVSLLSALLSVISNEVRLIAYECNDTRGGDGDRLNFGMSEHLKRKIGFIEDISLENMLVGIIGNDLFNEDYDLALRMKCSAARALAQVMELKGSRNELRIGEEEKRQMEEMLHCACLTGAVGESQGFQAETADEKSVSHRRIQNRARIHFWSEAFAGKWGPSVMQHSSRRMQDSVIRVAILGVAHLAEDHDNEYRIMVRRLVGSLGRMTTLEAVVGKWASEVYLLGNDGVDSEEGAEDEWRVPTSVQCVGKAVTSLAQGCGLGHVQSIIQSLEVSVRGWLLHCKDVSTVRDGLLIYSHLLCASAQLHGLRRGGSNAGWLQSWLVPIRQGVQKLQGRSWRGRQAEVRETLSWVQERVMGALGTVEQSGRDLETRICVTRMVNSFAQGQGSLAGFWRGGHVEVATAVGLGRAEERRRFERNVREWQKVVFHSAVDDQLRGGGAGRSYVELGYALGRFVEALECFGSERERCAVLVWQARQVYARVVAGELVGTLMGHVRLAGVWAKVERMIAETG